MSFRAVTFSKMGVKSEDHALIFDTVLNHTDGRIKGCDLTYDTNNLFIGTGFMIAQGRLLEIVGTHTVPVPAVQVGDQYVQIIFEIDLSEENTIQSFNQGDFKLVTSYDGWQPYVQEDLFSGGYVYQIPIARMMNNVNGVHSFEALLGSVVVSELWNQLELENEEYRNQFDVFFTEKKNIVLQMIAELEGQDFVTNTELSTILQNYVPPVVSNSNTVTEVGIALDARQANPNVAGSLASLMTNAGTVRYNSVTDYIEIVDANGVWHEWKSGQLIWNGYVYKDGTGAVLPLQIVQDTSGTGASITSTTYLKVHATNQQRTQISTQDTINVTNFSRMYIDYAFTNDNSSYNQGYLGAGLCVDKDVDNTLDVIGFYQVNRSNNIARNTVSINIESFSGEYYFKAFMDNNANGYQQRVYIYNVWFEE